jgi:hypothetical protein
MENNQQDMSRRAFSRGVLGCALCGVITLVLGPKLAAAEAKMSKAAAKYQGHPKGSAKCSKCSSFVSPDSCKVVAGSISPNGWCAHFSG